MRTLSFQRSSRLLKCRQWTCSKCLQFQAVRYNSSTTPGIVALTSDDPLIPTPLDATPLEENEVNEHKTRPHMKNKGIYYVTTPIFYVNGDPHVGHMHSMVVADVHKRYKELWGKTTVLSTGTDEHGMKVQKAALAKGQDPLEFCTNAAQKFQDLAQQINVSKHVFIRTTLPQHRIAVQHFWKVIQDAGYIYKGTHEGWYSVTDECFYKESQIEDRQDSTGAPIKVSKETGSAVEWTSEENYCFKLSKFGERLKHHYKLFPTTIVPKTYYQDVLSALSEPLEDLSISRPRSRLSWGIEVPGDPEQTIYVWFDALVNYLTVTGYPWINNKAQDSPSPVEETTTEEHTSSIEEISPVDTSIQLPPVKPSAWPADVHVIGKDIVRFHCIFWPAFLLAAGLPPPRQILVHGHWTLNGLKMSKSLGNVISPADILSAYPPDVIRYYMIKEGGQEGDGNWNHDSLKNRYTYLVNTWGNLISRMMSSKMDLRDAVHHVFNGDEYVGVESFIPEEDIKLRGAVESAIDVYRFNMNNLNYGAALTVLDNLWRAGNQYVTAVKPWQYTSEDVKDRLYSVQHQVGEVMRIGALFAQPFMPVKAAEMLGILGVHPKRRSLRYALWGVDTSYGRIKQKMTPVPYVFPRQEDENAPEGESMQELMKRKRAEKLALKEKLRQTRLQKAQEEFSRVKERILP